MEVSLVDGGVSTVMYAFECSVVVIEKRKKSGRKKWKMEKEGEKSFIETQWVVGV